MIAYNLKVDKRSVIALSTGMSGETRCGDAVWQGKGAKNGSVRSRASTLLPNVPLETRIGG